MRVLFLVLVFCLLQGPAGPLSAHAQTAELRFEHFPEVSPNVYAIHQDREGFLWLACWEGLYRYDGHEFKLYVHVPEDSTSLLSLNVRALYEDRRGTLWVANTSSGGPGGWNRYDQETDSFTRFPYEQPGIAASYVRRIGSMYQDPSGRYWTSIVDGGLREFNPETGAYTRHPGGAGSLAGVADDVFVFYEDRQGTLWMGSSDGLLRYDGASGTLTRFRHDPEDPAGIGAGAVPAVLEDSKGRLWIGTTEGGLCRMERPEGTFSCYRYDPQDPSSLSDNYVQALAEGRDGSLWIGTYRGGLNLFNEEEGTFQRFQYEPSRPAGTHSAGIRANQIQSIHTDRSGVLWVGTHGGGVSRLSRTAPLFTAYLPPAAHPAVWDLIEDRTGMLWLPTASGLFRLDRSSGRWSIFRHDPADPARLSSSTAAAVHEDRSGTIWVGTMSGLNRYDRARGTFTHFPHDPQDPSSLSDNYIRRIYEDRAGRLWIGTGKGLDLMDRETGTFRHFTHDPEDSSTIGPRYVLSMLEDSKGRFWIATTAGGLNLMDRESGTFTRFMNDPDDPESIAHNDVSWITETRSGELWVGTHDGLNRFDPDRHSFTRFDAESSCFPSNRVASILEDEQGYLWLNTGRGVVRFDPRDATCTVYDESSGLASLHGTPGAAFKNSRGEFFFGSFHGVHRFFPEQAKSDAQPPPVVLTGFRLFNEPVAPGGSGPLRQRIADVDEVILTHRQNSIGFAFAALDFVNPSKNQYAYMLDGFDEGWIQAGTRHEASYTNLPPGGYVFRVKGSNSEGVWNEQGASVRLTILPPWWRTPWAYAAYVLLFIAGLVLTDRVQRRRLIRRERQKAQITEARLRAEALQAENRRQELELEKARELKAMNARLEEQAERLLEMDRIKSRFFANISHEFRTPLTLILGPLQDALTGTAEHGFDHHQLSSMHRNCQRLLRLINQLLDLSKLEAGRMTLRARRADVIPFLKRLVFAFASRAEREHITLQFTASQEKLHLYVDPDKLEKVVSNLLSNALKFTPSYGKIRLSVETGVDERGAFAEIVVKDTGEGIPAEELLRIFDRFYQVDASLTRRHAGTGIGLSLARELVELHGGSIRVESASGFGSTFIVRLPQGKDHLSPEDVVSEEAAVDAEVRQEVASGDGAGWTQERAAGSEAKESVETESSVSHAPPRPNAPTVLVAEDNDELRAYIRRHLAAWYHVAEAVDGVDALEQAQRHPPDLIISDVMMPRMDGYALCRALKTDEKLNHIPVILLTAKAAEESKLEGLETGADDYLSKPFSMQELLVRVENLIEVRRVLRQRFSEEVVIGPSEVIATSQDAAFVEQVRQVVEAHLGDTNFGVDHLADEVGLSTRQLHRRLRELVELTPAGYIRLMRLERAAQLLRQQAGTVSEVAYRVGFQDAYYFSRLFKQTFGMAPSAFPKDPP